MPPKVAKQPIPKKVIAKPKPQPRRKVAEWKTFVATAYTPFCNTGCIGITKTGIDVSHTVRHNGKPIIAVDPRVVPLGSTVIIRLSNGKTFEAVAEDTGGDIVGNRIDLLVATEAEAADFGRQAVKVQIIRR